MMAGNYFLPPEATFIFPIQCFDSFPVNYMDEVIEQPDFILSYSDTGMVFDPGGSTQSTSLESDHFWKKKHSNVLETSVPSTCQCVVFDPGGGLESSCSYSHLTCGLVFDPGGGKSRCCWVFDTGD